MHNLQIVKKIGNHEESWLPMSCKDIVVKERENDGECIYGVFFVTI